MSQKIIKLTPDSEGRAYLQLYGEKIEVTDRADRKGKGEVEAFGEIYHFQIVKAKAEKPVEEAPTEEEAEPETQPEEASKEVSDEN